MSEHLPLCFLRCTVSSSRPDITVLVDWWLGVKHQVIYCYLRRVGGWGGGGVALFNTELSPERYLQGPRSQEAVEERNYMPIATMLPPEWLLH